MNVSVGDEIPPRSIDAVSPEPMKTVAAILRDPTPIHWDRTVTATLGFDGRLLNQSPVNLGYIINMLIDWAGPCCVRRIRSKFPQPVFDGDSCTAGGRVVGLSATGEDTIAECEVWLDRDDGVRSVMAKAWVALPQDESEHTQGI